MSNVKTGDLAVIIAGVNKGKMVKVGPPVVGKAYFPHVKMTFHARGRTSWHITMLSEPYRIVGRNSKRVIVIGMTACELDSILQRIAPPGVTPKENKVEEFA